MKRFTTLLLISLNFFISAEVVTDGSLGKQLTLSGPDYLIDQSLGTSAGTNLFHSFSKFNLTAGESATFNGSSSITNIIGRITGGKSTIDGQVNCSIDGANLFLLNQSGILFGANASVNLTGSFHASTADYLQLGEKARFYSEPISGELLSSAPPSAFGFLGNNGSIVVDGSMLQSGGGSQISLTAAGLTVKNGAKLNVGEGSLNLVSLNSGSVELNGNVKDFKGAELDIRDASTLTSKSAIYIKGGVVLVDSSAITVESYENASKGELSIEAEQTVISKTIISSLAKGNSKGASIAIKSKSVKFEDSLIHSLARERTKIGSSGDILIQAERISLDNSDLSSLAYLNMGLSGDISIYAKDLSLVNGSSIVNNKLGMGQGKNGFIHLEIDNELWLSGSNIGSETIIGMVDGGGITIHAGQLRLERRASITASSRGMGGAGQITINAQNAEVLSGSFVSSSALSRGKGGDLVFNISNELKVDGSLRLSDNSVAYSQILGESRNQGNGGNIYINAHSLSLTNSAFISTASKALSRPGDAGDIVVKAGLVDMVDAQITAESTGSRGGRITINSDSYLSLTNGAITTAVHKGTGNAGDITLNSQSMVMNNSMVKTDAFGGDGGDILVKADAILKNYESYFDASSELGVAGEIISTAPEIYINEETEELVTEFLPAEDWVNDSARARLGNRNSFVISKHTDQQVSPQQLLFVPVEQEAPVESPVTNELKQFLGF